MNSLVPWRSREGSLMPRGEHPVEQFRRDFDALFDRLWGGSLASYGEDWGSQRVWDFDVQDRDKEVVVRAELPGFDEKELDIQVSDNVLTIKAEKEQKGDGQQRWSRFQRSFTLPTGADPDKIEANYRNGVLEMHIPRAEGAGPKRIRVQGQQGAIGRAAQASTGKGAQPGNGSKNNPAETKASEKAQK